MKTEMLPEFARPFKTKGHDVRKIANEYYLYRVEHFRVSDKKYPVTKYVYIGRIDREKGLIPSHAQNDGEVIACLEYGLSDYIYSNYRRYAEFLWGNPGDRIFLMDKKTGPSQSPAFMHESFRGTDVRVLTHGSPCRPLLLRVCLVDGEAFRRHFLGERKVAFRKVLLPDLRKQPFQISLRVEPVDKRVLDQRRRCA